MKGAVRRKDPIIPVLLSSRIVAGLKTRTIRCCGWLGRRAAGGGWRHVVERAAVSVGATTVLVALIGVTPLRAHHSFPSYYFEEQMVRIQGELIEFDYRAPHAWVKVLTRDASGTEQVISAEWSNPNRLARDGVTKTTLNIGDVVVVAGSPGRNPDEHRIHLKAIQRLADGWEWPQNRRR